MKCLFWKRTMQHKQVDPGFERKEEYKEGSLWP